MKKPCLFALLFITAWGTQAAAQSVNVYPPQTGAFLSATAAANPAATTSASFVMMGLGSGWKLTPTKSGNLLINVSGNVTPTTNASYHCSFEILYGTGTAPANGAALTGTAIGGQGIAYFNTNANGAASLFSTGVGGLTVGTAYWFDIALLSSTAGNNCSANSVSAAISEQ